MTETIAAISQASKDSDAIICCPACLRSYPVHASMSGKLALCANCDAYFVINVTELKLDGETAIVLREPISLRVSFIQEGCAEMARNISDLLKLAGEPVTREAVLMIAKSVPCYLLDVHENWWRRGLCNKTMEKAFHRSQGTAMEARLNEIVDYLVGDIPRRHLVTVATLIGAFAGVLSVGFDQPKPESVSEPPVKKRGRLERWAERMGW
jgi:hypothetical protein